MNKLTAIKSTSIAAVVTALYGTGISPAFLGPVGIGKSDGVAKAAGVLAAKESARLNRSVQFGYTVETLSNYSEVDVRGYLVPSAASTPGGPIESRFTKPAFWRAIDANPDGGILFFDEFMQATHEVQKAVASLLLDRRIGEFVLPAGWMVVLAGNDVDDNAGANDVLSHVVNRVCMLRVTHPSCDEWISWAQSNNIPFELQAFAQLRWPVITAAPGDGINEPFPTLRSFARTGVAANAYPGGIRAMVDNEIGRAIIEGMVGPAAASELVATVKLALNLPSMEQVMASPSTAMVPTRTDEAYVMVHMVASRADPHNADAVLTYLSRFRPDMAVVAIVAMVRRSPELVRVPAMTNWILANSGLVDKFNSFITRSIKGA